MISRSDIKKRSYRLLEIAIVVSFVLHLLFGGLAMFHQHLDRKALAAGGKEGRERRRALNDDHDREAHRSRVLSRNRSLLKPKPQPPRPQVQPQAPVAAQPIAKPVPQVVPVPRSAPQELAKIVPHAKEHVAVNKPQVVARIAVPKTNPNKLTQAQLNEMNQRFAQTIDAARAANDPTHVTSTAPPGTMKRAHLDMSGVNAMLTHGEGILTPADSDADQRQRRFARHVLLRELLDELQRRLAR